MLFCSANFTNTACASKFQCPVEFNPAFASIFSDSFFHCAFGRIKKSYALHQGKANVVFCDGHVESPTLQFLFADTSDAALSRWNRDHQPHREKLSP
jgi:prepilin-type processing-associated H-X9-DG protein